MRVGIILSLIIIQSTYSFAQQDSSIILSKHKNKLEIGLTYNNMPDDFGYGLRRTGWSDGKFYYHAIAYKYTRSIGKQFEIKLSRNFLIRDNRNSSNQVIPRNKSIYASNILLGGAYVRAFKVNKTISLNSTLGTSIGFQKAQEQIFDYYKPYVNELYFSSVSGSGNVLGLNFDIKAIIGDRVSVGISSEYLHRFNMSKIKDFHQLNNTEFIRNFIQFQPEIGILF